MAQPDEKVKKEFIELQQKLYMNSSKLKQVQSQARNAAQEKRKAELTLKELTQMPADVNTYRTVGRCFILETKEDMERELGESITSNESIVTSSKGNIEYLTQTLKSTEDDIRDLLRSSPALASQIAGVSG